MVLYMFVLFSNCYFDFLYQDDSMNAVRSGQPKTLAAALANSCLVLFHCNSIKSVRLSFETSSIDYHLF